MGLLHDAVEQGDLERARLLLAQGFDINERGYDSETPLHMAVASNRLDFVKFLVHQGADLDTRTLCGDTPLLSSSRSYGLHSGISCIFEFLLSCDADVSIRNNKGRTVLHQILYENHASFWIKRFFDTMRTMGTDPRTLFWISGYRGDSPLHCLEEGVASAMCLVECGFDSTSCGVQSTWMCPTMFSIRNSRGETPYGSATEKGYLPDVAKYLDSFESLPLINLASMKVNTELNEFQRFVARRIYYTTLCKKLCPDVAFRVMAFLSPADVMK